MSCVLGLVGCNGTDPLFGGDEGVPTSGYCDPVSDWEQELVDMEVEVLALVNDARSNGADCGSAGSFGAAGPLAMQENLRCAARVHSMDMVERGYFDHTNPDGESPWDRMARAGYSHRTAGENIAAGYPTAEAVVQGWLDSDGHCSNIMNDGFEEIGVGLFDRHWTQVFGTPQ